MSFKKWSLLVMSVLLVSCSPNKQHTTQQTENIDKKAPIYKVLQAHGGIEKWNDQQTLSFELGDQKHTIDLKSREVKIATPNYSMGNDGGTVWLKQDSTYFQGSPRFHHSLMFYFYSMPFVLADDGINYEEIAYTEIMGEMYKGIKMSFNEGVGDSPDDEYILFYNLETNKMEWLAYTATFRSQQDSDDFNMIHYKNWKEVDGFLLPTELQWHKFENGEVGPASGDARIFTNIQISDENMDETFFNMPEGAEVDSAGTP